MRIIHLSTSVYDSSAVVRQHLSLLKLGIDSNILTLENHANPEINNIITVKQNAVERIINKCIGGIEKLFNIICRVDRYKNMPFSFAIKNVPINKYICKDDIIHLHWAVGFISLNQYQKLLNNYKVVVSFHDNFYLTGGCHVKLSCQEYKTGCKSCPYYRLKYIPHIFYTKKIISEKRKPILISPSKWMNENVIASEATKNGETRIVPNTLNINIFSRQCREEVRTKLGIDNCNVLLFGAVSGVEVKYKGFNYLIQALLSYQKHNPSDNIVLLVFGSDHIEEKVADIGFPVINLGKIYSMIELAKIYSAADVFIVPSLEDSFNQTVVESLCCETPVVAFKTGGIIENVEHMKSGFLAEYADSTDLEKGIKWTLQNNQGNRLGKYGRAMMAQKCNEETVGRQLTNIYNYINAK